MRAQGSETRRNKKAALVEARSAAAQRRAERRQELESYPVSAGQRTTIDAYARKLGEEPPAVASWLEALRAIKTLETRLRTLAAKEPPPKRWQLERLEQLARYTGQPYRRPKTSREAAAEIGRMRKLPKAAPAAPARRARIDSWLAPAKDQRQAGGRRRLTP